MSKDNEMEGAQTGYCEFCHQGQIIETIGECTQDRLNEIATEKCSCSEAKSFRRQRERREKVDKYIERNFGAETVPTIKSLAELIEHGEFDQIVITHELTGWKTTMKTDKDGYLVITKKKTVQGESLRE